MDHGVTTITVTTIVPRLPHLLQAAGNTLVTVPVIPMTMLVYGASLFHQVVLVYDLNYTCFTFLIVSQCTNGSVRLVGGETAREGRLEYCYHGVWSQFCNTFHLEEATVACKQLGFTNSPGIMHELMFSTPLSINLRSNNIYRWKIWSRLQLQSLQLFFMQFICQ